MVEEVKEEDTERQDNDQGMVAELKSNDVDENGVERQGQEPLNGGRKGDDNEEAGRIVVNRRKVMMRSQG